MAKTIACRQVLSHGLLSHTKKTRNKTSHGSCSSLDPRFLPHLFLIPGHGTLLTTRTRITRESWETHKSCFQLIIRLLTKALNINWINMSLSFPLTLLFSLESHHHQVKDAEKRGRAFGCRGKLREGS